MEIKMHLRFLCTFFMLFNGVYSNAYSVQIGSTTVCMGDTTALYNLSGIPNTATVQWDLGNTGFYNSAVGDTVYYVFNQSGNLLVNLKITDTAGNVYYNTSPLVVTVYADPDVNFAYAGTCNGQTTSFTNLSSVANGDALTYAWYFNNSGVIGSTAINPLNQYPAPGNYRCILTATSNHNCVSSDTQSVTIYTKPVALFSYTDTCQAGVTILVNTSQLFTDSLIQSIWTLGNGELSFNTDTVRNVFSADTTYNVTLNIRNSHGCADTITEPVIIKPMVNTVYTYSPDSIIYPGHSATILVTGTFTSLVWNDGTSQNPKTVTDSGYYQYTAVNQWGCTQTETAHIIMPASKPGIEPANDIITPNGDGINDALVFKNLENFNSCKIQIYNMAGLLVYSAGTYTNNWNGTDNGKQVNAGTYYYVINCDGQYELKGNTNIIR